MIKKLNKRLVSFTLAFTMVFVGFLGFKGDNIVCAQINKSLEENYWFTSSTKTDYSREIRDAKEKSVNYILGIKDLSNWHAAALRAASVPIPDRYIERVERVIRTKDPELIKNGEIADNDCETTIIGVTAAGKNAENISDFNLIEHLCKKGKIDDNKVHSSIFALIALDCGKYKIPSSSNLKRQDLINNVIWVSEEEGGWAPWGGDLDPDTTGMALTALAPYKDDEEVKFIIDNAIERLSEVQNENGGYKFEYKDEYNESSESVAQVIIGLCSNNEDPTSEKFTKNQKNLIDALLSFRTEDGFSHIKNGKTNNMATYQALQAISAYERFKSKKEGIYSFENFFAK